VEHGAVCIFCPPFHYFLPRTIFYLGVCLGGENSCRGVLSVFFISSLRRVPDGKLSCWTLFDPQISGMFCLASPRVHGYTKWSFHAVSPCIYRLGKYGLDLGLKKLPGGCSLVAVVISVFWCGIDFFPRISVLGHISCSSVLVRTASALDLFSVLFSFFTSRSTFCTLRLVASHISILYTSVRIRERPCAVCLINLRI
jgi:hypothetical protein